MQERLLKNTKITLSILFCFLGLFLVLFTYLSDMKKEVFNEKNLAYLDEVMQIGEIDEEVEIEDIIEEVTITSTIIKQGETTTTSKTTINYNYIGYLEIPKINFKRGFVDYNSKYNKLNYNIMMLAGSKMPDVENGNLMFAAHRGNSSVSFFDKLYKLNIGDEAYVTYNNEIYKYKLVNSYLEDKDGVLTVRRNSNKNVLTLITCTRNDKKTQTVFIFELERK